MREELRRPKRQAAPFSKGLPKACPNPPAANRQVWGSNRTEAGAPAQEVLMTILWTARQHRRDTLNLMYNLLCGRQPRLALLPVGP